MGVGRQKVFFTTAQRYIGYLIECLGVRPIDHYTSKDATILREWLIKKGLSKSSLQRVFSGVKAVINFVVLEQGLDCQNAFAKVYLPSEENVEKRHAISPANLPIPANQQMPTCKPSSRSASLFPHLSAA